MIYSTLSSVSMKLSLSVECQYSYMITVGPTCAIFECNLYRWRWRRALRHNFADT